MKKVLLIGIVLLWVPFLSGCKNTINPSDTSIPGEIDLKDPELNPEEPMYSGCLVTYGTNIAGKNFDSESFEWTGYHKLGNQKGKVPTRMIFTAEGNIKMYTKPTETEDWQLVHDFNVDRMRVSTEDENVDDIIEFPKATDYCIFEDTKENANKDFPCITLYPEGQPIQANSPFNIEVCLKGMDSITVNMLKHTFYLSF